MYNGGTISNLMSPTSTEAPIKGCWPDGCDEHGLQLPPATPAAAPVSLSLPLCVCCSLSAVFLLLADSVNVVDNLYMVVRTLTLLAPDVWQPTFKPVKIRALGGRQLCYSFIEYSNIRSFRKDSIRNDLEYSF